MKKGRLWCKRTLLFVFCGAAFIFPLPAQDAGLAGEAAGPDENAAARGGEAPPADPDLSVYELDIKTSTLTELASWCRTVGLSDAGSREELARRLRDYYALETPSAGTAQPGRRVITIESARTSEYFTLEAVDEEYARLRGNVVVSLKEGNAAHRISAREILYNRTRNIMTASGGVEYEREQEDTIETFKGESITVNLDNWAGVFLAGFSERSDKDDDTAYRFSGTVISRSGDEVTVLADAEISNAKNTDSLWSLKASKLWLLPGSDFAIFNAVLKVGEIPVLYIPFLHIPADEIIFHPVLGYRSREGSFLQTTTYLLGRPKASSSTESSVSKIFGGGGESEKRREGIFLRSTGKKVRNTEEPTLKTIFDLYAKLGVYLGTDLSIPASGNLGLLDVSAGLGFSRTLTHLSDGSYSPFAPAYDGQSDWNRSRLISWDVPFRYRFNASGSFSSGAGSFTWALPYYSDPYTDRDFLDRSEEMDWMHIVQEGASIMDTEASETEIQNFEWRVSGSFNPNFPGLAPYVSAFSVSGLSSAVAFRTREVGTSHSSFRQDSPSNKFFFPDKFTIYSINTSVTGTPFSWTVSGINAETAPAEEEGTGPLLPGIPIAPWPAAGDGGQQTDGAGGLAPPSLNQRFDLPLSGGPRFSIDYRLNPSSATELQWRSAEVGTYTNWQTAGDIDWNEISSVMSIFRGEGSLGFTLDHTGGGAYTTAVTFSGTAAWQDFAFLNTDAEEFSTSGKADSAKVMAARERNYSSTYYTTSFDYSTRLRPFYQSSVWGDTSLTYGARGLMARTEFLAGSGSDPEWDVIYGAWDRESLESHQIAANIAARIMDKAQTLVLSADLPPEEIILSGNATARAWISETNTNMKFFPEGRDEANNDKRYLDFLYSTETLRFGDTGSLQQYMIYDPHEKVFTTLTTTLTLGGLSASYTAARMMPYRLETTPPIGWVTSGDETLCPRDFTLGYVKSLGPKKIWDDRLSLSFNINTSLNVDLQRFTYSRFRFTAGFTVDIANFLDVTLSANSENAVVYRYLQGIPYFRLPNGFEVTGEKNPFRDLIDSFRFDDPLKRAGSGFKLKSFTLTAVHHLGDWNAKLGLTLSPYLPTGGTKYVFNNEVSFVVQWVPIKEIKTDISVDKEVWAFK
ncbi:MAG: LPS-assembly protein LptD [Treponema sp.]|jgi:lipopolysaccharide assembly outer membrane protein LptD (OstA)|nr:LPS-assembly protein LptD [Treponema sp.]